MRRPNITYVADLSQDVDDIIAATYLMRRGLLDHLVCDPEPTDGLGLWRLESLRKAGADVAHDVPDDTEIALIGGAITKVAAYVERHDLESIAINGGFVGRPVVPDDVALPKFRGHATQRTYNFGLNEDSTRRVLSSHVPDKIVLVGKNVCHDPRNTREGVWSDEKWLDSFDVRPHKRLHDLLMVREALVELKVINDEPFCEFETLWPYDTQKDGHTCWGSSAEPTRYRHVRAATNWLP